LLAELENLGINVRVDFAPDGVTKIKADSFSDIGEIREISADYCTQRGKLYIVDESQ
jgi:hypothetical protein